MTLPDERTNAVRNTRLFLYRLINAKDVPGIPKEIRREALALLKHFPTLLDLVHAANDAPKVFSKPDLEGR